MDGATTANRSRGVATARLECRAIGVRSKFAARIASFDFPANVPIWSVEGPLGPYPLSPLVLDLLDLVGAIYRVESGIPMRPTNPIIRWEVAAPVRKPAFWRNKGGPLLSAALEFLTRAQWTLSFSRHVGAVKPKHLLPVKPDKSSSLIKDVQQVVLFSGGMDSTCGAGIHVGDKRQVQLVSFFSRQKRLQQELAQELGYGPPTQWRLGGQRGHEGLNLIRSIMFLSLACATASSFGTSEILQYENGVLALAIPPSGSSVPTRHAHPEFHRRMEALFQAVLGRPIFIKNPCLLLTKRQMAERFTGMVGQEVSDRILARTETCWRLFQAHVAGKKKKPSVPCGVCTPCIVRRTARPQEVHPDSSLNWPGYANDLIRPHVQRHKMGLSFRAWLELVNLVLDTEDDDQLVEDLPSEARQLIDGPAGPSTADAVKVLRHFAAEFCETFGIKIE